MHYPIRTDSFTFRWCDMAYEAIPRMQVTKTSCVGASLAYVLQHVAIKAGYYMPDLQRSLISKLNLRAHGTTLDAANNWLRNKQQDLRRIHIEIGHLVCDIETSELLSWVQEGRGLRGAVVGVDVALLRQIRGIGGSHAVALIYTTNPDLEGAPETAALADPWPDFWSGEAEGIPSTLVEARAARGNTSLLVEWQGDLPDEVYALYGEIRDTLPKK